MKPSIMAFNNDREVKMETRKFRKKTVIAILTVLCSATISKATLVNSNSVVQDGIEYYIQTDKAVYDLGEDIEMLFRVTNLRGELVTINFDDQVHHYFTVKQNEYLIWYSPKAGLPAGSELVLLPSGYKEYTETWDMLDNQGALIMSANYEVTGSFHPVLLSQEDEDKYVPVSVQIEIIPEPSAFVLFGISLMALLSYRKRKKF